MALGISIGIGVSAIAMAAGAWTPAPISITTAAELEAAAASATPGQVFSLDADITAPAAALLSWPAGVTILEPTTRQISGYYWRFYSGGNYATTRLGSVPRRLTLVSPTTNAAGTYNGTVECREGNFSVYAKVTGPNGGGNKVGNLVNFGTLNGNRVEANFYGGAENSSADCVSIDVGAGGVPETSYLRAWSPRCRAPGSAGSDNWFTGHGNVPCQVFNPDFATPSTSGPGINSAPVNATMEVYGGVIDMTGAGSLGDLYVTRLVGTQIIGSTTRTVYLVADALKPTKPAVCLRVQSSASIVVKGVHTVAPIYGEVEMTVAGKYIGSLAASPDYAGPAPLIAKIKGTLTSANDGLVVLSKGGDVYNITTVNNGAANVYALKCSGAGVSGTPNVINLVRADINNTSPVTMTYATRSDVQYTTMNVTNSRITATNAGFTGGATGSSLNVSGTLLNGTEPSGGLTGWLNKSPELAAVSRWDDEVEPYLATCPSTPGGDGWPSTLDGFLT